MDDRVPTLQDPDPRSTRELSDCKVMGYESIERGEHINIYIYTPNRSTKLKHTGLLKSREAANGRSDQKFKDREGGLRCILDALWGRASRFPNQLKRKSAEVQLK
jgi:hypothetical protein